MIAYLDGVLLSFRGNDIILNVNNVGYLVSIPSSYSFEKGMELQLFIETIIRENAHTLYGFKTEEDRERFILFTSVQGVGPKIALSLVGVQNIGSLIKSESTSELIKINGVGKKMAERLIQELKDKFTTAELVAPVKVTENMTVVSCKQALKSLGYGKNDIDATIASYLTTKDNENVTVQEMLQECLKIIGKAS